MKSIFLLWGLLLPIYLSAQSFSLHPEINKKLDDWYNKHKTAYKLLIHEDQTKAQVAGYYENTANLIRVEWKGMLLEFAFKKDIAKISTNADSLQKYWKYASANNIYMDIDAPKWDIYPSTSKSSYSKGVRFRDEGNDQFSVEIQWDVFAVLGYKKSKYCEEKMARVDAPTPPECMVSRRKKMDFILDVKVPIKAVDAPKLKQYPKYLKEVSRSFANKELSVLGYFENQDLLSYNKKGEEFEFQYFDKDENLIWSYNLDREGLIYYPLEVDRDAEGNIYLLCAAYEMSQKGYAILLKLDKTGKLLWKIVEDDIYRTYRTLHAADNGDLLLGGSMIKAYNKKGKERWKYYDPNISIQINKIIASDNGYMAVGMGKLEQGQKYENNMIAIQLDQSGHLLGKANFGGSRMDEAEAVCPTADGGWIIAGESNSKDGDVEGLKGDNNIWVIKLNKKLKIKWQHCLGSSYVVRFSPFQVVAAVFETENEEVLIIGHNTDDDIEVEDIGDVDGYVALLSKKGELLWQQSLGTLGFDHIPFAQLQQSELLLILNQELVQYKVSK